jgi:hypothetical protein
MGPEAYLAIYFTVVAVLMVAIFAIFIFDSNK